jgi:hypothetical protein
MLSNAARVPVVVGLNTTLIVQLVPGSSVVKQVAADCKKSAESDPVKVADRANAVEVLFLAVTCLDELPVPTFWLPNVRLPGVTETGIMPIPDRFAD